MVRAGAAYDRIGADEYDDDDGADDAPYPPPLASAAPGVRVAAAMRPQSRRAAAFFRSIVAGEFAATASNGAVRGGALRNALRAKGGCRAAAEARNAARLTKRIISGDVLLFCTEFCAVRPSVTFFCLASHELASVSTH